MMDLAAAEEKFNQFVVRRDGCWAWMGGGLCRGYPLVRVGRHSIRGNRLSWVLHYGPIPKGMCALHLCDNPACTNPEHLFLGSQLDNVADMIRKGRALYQRDRERMRHVGSTHGNAKLTEDDVRWIRQARKEGITQMAIAKKFGVTRGLIGHISRGVAWTHV